LKKLNNNQTTNLGRILTTAEGVEKYDACAKRILSDKNILSFILKYSVSEFEKYNMEDIKDFIESSPEVTGTYLSTAMSKFDSITGMSTESCLPYEGNVSFDVRFFTQENNYRKILFDTELQNNFSPGYDLTSRGVFYCARMLSMELDTEFSSSDYNNMKKVYSIWICTDVPAYADNTITEYKMSPEDIYGNMTIHKKYDYLSVILICIGKKPDKNNKLLSLLHLIFSSDESSEKKLFILENEYNLTIYKQTGKEIENMGSLGMGVWQKAMTEGHAKGRAEGRAEERTQNIKTTISSMKFHNMKEDDICAIICTTYNLTKDELRAYM